MLDIQFIRENPELVKEKSQQKGYDVDIDQLLKVDADHRAKLTQIEDMRRQRNELADQAKGQRPTDEQLAAGRQLKEQLAQAEAEIASVEETYLKLLKAVPNMPLDEVPVGTTEADNKVIRTVGDRPAFDFQPKPHWEIANDRDLMDKERATKIAGSRFVYLKGDLVRLQFAIVQFVLQTLGNQQILQKLIDDNGLHISAKPFTPVLPPAMLHTEPYVASARLNAEEVTYRAGQPEDDLWLNASAEHTLCTMYWNEILPEAMFPIRYIGYSTSFRREAGTYGKDTEGLIRMHQFDKLEMEIFSTPETGRDEHLLTLAIQEHLVQQLGLPYQVLQKSTFDIGKPNSSGYDVECWFPGEGRYIETHTADFMGEYQARDLKTRVRRDSGAVQLVHTIDATAFALGRILAAIIENYQTVDGHIRVPEALIPYIGGQTEL